MATIAPTLSDEAGNEERAELLRADQEKEPERSWCSKTYSDLPTILLDIIFSIPFYYVMWIEWDPTTSNCIIVMILALMVLWRLHRAYSSSRRDPNMDGENPVPYTVGVCKSNDKTMFLVATIHISPRAPRDVAAVIEGYETDERAEGHLEGGDSVVMRGGSRPDIVMIELDEERLDRMRGPPEEALRNPQPKEEDLQAIKIRLQGQDDKNLFAQRALWNAERSGDSISGNISYDKDNQYGLVRKALPSGSVSLVHRGSADGEFAPFALKAHLAHRSGAGAVLFINKDDNLPLGRIGASGSIWADVKVGWKSGSCGFPPIPGLLITQTDGEKLMAELEDGNRIGTEILVKADSYPRRTLRKRLCQACALIFSGIGILYGIIQCFAVEVGGEFIEAEECANRQKIPCVCIDSNLNDFWGKLGEALLPTPCNLIDSLLAWLALPRVAFQALFPPRHNVDVFGSMILHGKSFSIRTWVAFILAGYVASFVTSHVMEFFTAGAERVGEKSGVVKKEDREYTQTLILLILQLYMLPRIYEAVAASRDEVMYRSICVKGRQNDSKRMVVVVGAGHSNGILQRARTRGL